MAHSITISIAQSSKQHLEDQASIYLLIAPAIITSTIVSIYLYAISYSYSQCAISFLKSPDKSVWCLILLVPLSLA